MFDVQINKLKENKIFFIIIPIILIIFISVNFLIDYEMQAQETDLEVNGESNINSLVINEIMTSNDGAVADGFGLTYDWVEIYNGESKAINLKNYSLTDDSSTVKWVFPEVTIEAGEYLVVYLSGDYQEGLYASFKLKSSGGEELILTNSAKKVLDAVETVSLSDNQVMARDLDGNWLITSTFTPGYINTIEGQDKYRSNLWAESDLVINEVLVRNNGNFANEDGIYSGYIEILNLGDEINLNGYSISNTYDAPFKYQIGDVTLKTGEVYLIYTEDYSSDLNYSNFKLTSKTGEAILTNNTGQIIDAVEYTNLTSGVALILEDGVYYESSDISPGFTNDLIEQFLTKYKANNNTLIINEVMNNNISYLVQNGDNYYDWVELKNNSNESINLSDYYLTTDETIEKYKLPDVVLEPGELFVIMCSGDTNLSNTSYYHADFKIGDNESIYILKDKEIVDSVFVYNLTTNYSYGRNNTNGFYYISTPTPNKSNNSGSSAIAYVPLNNTVSGIYDDVTDLSIELTANGTIYYTLDGSTPTSSSNVYTSPIFLSETSVIKYMAVEANKKNSEITTMSYIINENHTMPVLSVVTDQSEFDNLQSDAWNETLEISANAELFEDDGTFNIDCGLKLFGGSTRGLDKKSFQLKFRSEYGASKLNYQVFDDRDFSSFDSLVLRSGSQDYENAFIRDVLGTSLVDDYTDIDVQAYKPVVLYINGEYWGVYNIREKVEEEFISNHYSVDESANIIRIDNDITAGSITEYSSLISYVNAYNLSVDSYYDYIDSQINLVNLCDFWIAQNYVTNNDIVNVRMFSHEDVDDGKWSYIFYDLDYAFYNYSTNYYTFSTSATGMREYGYSTDFLRNLMENEEFQELYLQRLSYNLEYTWNKEIVLERLDEIYNYYLPEMSRDKERWGSTLEDWQSNIEDLKTYIEKRETYLLAQTKSFFNLTDAQMEEYFG